MKNHLTFFIIIHVLVASSLCIAMDEPNLSANIKESRTIALFKERVAVGGKNGCIIFNAQTRKPIQVVTTEEVCHIATNKDKTLLAVSTRKGPLLHNIKTGEQARPKEYIDEWEVFVTFSTIDDTLFSYKEARLISYNPINKQQTNNYLESQPEETMGKDFISYHPARKELLYTSGNKKLSITQLEPTLFTKASISTNFRCLSANYAPDGHTIAIYSPQNKQRNYFICDLNTYQDLLPAHQLIADNKDYCASTFDEQDSMIFLLSEDGYVHCFDYIKRNLIATTKQLIFSDELSYDFRPRKRLDCNGKKVAAALGNTWVTLDIPQNNFCTIWHALYLYKTLPKELVKIILLKILDSHKQSYDYFDLNALLSVTRITPATAEQTIGEPMELETEV